MEIGFTLPHLHNLAHEVNRVSEFAQEAEKAGAASLWVGDRNFTAVNPKIGAGGIGNTIPEEYRTVADPFVLLGVAAAATERVRLGTHVLLAPLYPPAQLVRSLTTIDLISEGRLTAGFGVGWSPEEYEGANLDFHKRGARMDELLDAIELLWTGNPVEYHGKHIEVPLQYAPLKPVQRPHPPIYLAGVTEPALRRAATRGSGWMALCIIPVFADVDMMLAQRALVDRFAAEAGRDPAAIDTIMKVNIVLGTPLGQVADTIKSIAERTGIDHFVIESASLPNLDASMELVTEMMTLLKQG
jgi:probable F420-dependent oxidoreductase